MFNFSNRSTQQASNNILLALLNDKVSGSFIDTFGYSHDLTNDIVPRDKAKDKIDELERMQKRKQCIENCESSPTVNDMVSTSSSGGSQLDACRKECLMSTLSNNRLNILSGYRSWLYPSDSENKVFRNQLWDFSDTEISKFLTKT